MVEHGYGKGRVPLNSYRRFVATAGPQSKQWFSTMDLASGYWHVAMSPDASRKAAFVQFRVKPFGLCNAPATFERLMEWVLPSMPWLRYLVYLDDMISFGADVSRPWHC